MFVFVLSVFLSISLASAVSLNGYTVELKCRADFVSRVSGSLGVNNDSKLQQDENQIQTCVSQGNLTLLKDYVKGNFDNDLKNARESIVGWRKQARNESLSDRQKIISQYNSAKSGYESCSLDALKMVAQNKVQQDIYSLNKYQNMSNALASKGYDVSSINSLINNAQNQIVNPLQDAISSSTSAQQLRTALNSYCLFDGCNNGTNFHFAAKYDLARYQIIFNSIEQNSTSLNVSSSSLTSIQTSLTDAQSVLTAVGSVQYTNTQRQQLSQDLKSAAEGIKAIVKQINVSWGKVK